MNQQPTLIDVPRLPWAIDYQVELRAAIKTPFKNSTVYNLTFYHGPCSRETALAEFWKHATRYHATPTLIRIEIVDISQRERPTEKTEVAHAGQFSELANWQA